MWDSRTMLQIFRFVKAHRANAAFLEDKINYIVFCRVYFLYKQVCSLFRVDQYFANVIANVVFSAFRELI